MFSRVRFCGKERRSLVEGGIRPSQYDVNVPKRWTRNSPVVTTCSPRGNCAMLKRELSFDDPLSKFIPDLPNEKLLRRSRSSPAKHTAGLEVILPAVYDRLAGKLRTVDDMMKLASQDEKELSSNPARNGISNTVWLSGKVTNCRDKAT